MEDTDKPKSLKPHKTAPWYPDTPGHNRREGASVRGKQQIKNIKDRTEYMRRELGLLTEPEK